MNIQKPTITRKELAQITGLSVKQIATHERKWGLYIARVPAQGLRCVLYRTAVARRVLIAIGLVE